MEKKNEYRLSPQFVGSVMLALQKAMMAVAAGKPEEECDLNAILSGFVVRDTEAGLQVINPPVLEMPVDEPEEGSDG